MSIDNHVNGVNEDSQRRGSVKDKVYERSVSILVVIYAQDTKRVPMLQRCDDSDFRQSITDSVEKDETAPQAATREVKEEITIDVVAEQLTLIDCQRTVEFEILLHLRHCYAPDVIRNTESWFCLALLRERQIIFTEHLACKWFDASATAVLTKFWNNRQAIEQSVTNAA